jgi:hypothetical protein
MQLAWFGCAPRYGRLRHEPRTQIGITAWINRPLRRHRLVHLGPFYVRPGDYVLLTHTALLNGQNFFAVGHRTESLTEPYEVTLYKVEPDLTLLPGVRGLLLVELLHQAEQEFRRN